MRKETRKLICSYLVDYLMHLNKDLKITKNSLFVCPFHSDHPEETKATCKIYPNYGYKLKCFNSNHGDLGDIFDVFRKAEPDMKNLTDEEIGDYLINLLNISTDEKIDDLLATYSNSGFGLIPLAPNSKDPVSGISWKKNISYDINQWKEWLSNGLGLGLVGGKISKVIMIDIDSPETLEKVKDLIPNTATQKTKRGFHFILNYDENFDFVNHVNLRSKGYEMEVRVNNAYIVVAPTIVDNFERSWNGAKIANITPKLKKFLLELIEKPKEEKKDEIKEAIDKNDLGIKNGLTGLDGECNDTFVKLGGILRKKMSPEQVEYSLMNFNKLLADPMNYQEVKAMCYQINKYDNFDKKDLANQILQHLQMESIKTATSTDLYKSLGHPKKEVEEALNYLLKEQKIQKCGRVYKYIEKVEWETDFMGVGKPLGYEVPWFGKYNNFENSSLIILGGKTGEGKSHCAINLVKEFVEQGKRPYYICTEAGSKFKLISATLGLKEGDYLFKIVPDATAIELEDDAITIVDWLNPKDYSQVGNLMETMNNRLVQHGGLLIIFVQVRKDGSFFAPDLFDFYASCVAKYCHSKKTNEVTKEVSYDNENTYWKTEKLRDSKVGIQYVTIPMHYNSKTKRITIRGEK